MRTEITSTGPGLRTIELQIREVRSGRSDPSGQKHTTGQEMTRDIEMSHHVENEFQTKNGAKIFRYYFESELFYF